MDGVFIFLCFLACGYIRNGVSALWQAAEANEDQCDIAIREIMNEDRATVVDESTSRLHAVWISQECEIWAGPEFIIRKYSFFENGTFLLMRHYYAEESCSIATYSVLARGVIKILGNSLMTSGATEARYQLDTVHVSPLNRQVAHKLGHRVNISCGPQPRWKPYVAQLIYERPPEHFGPSGSLTWQGPKYNSLQGHQDIIRPGGTHISKSVDCLAPLGIDFDELRLLRVQRRPTGFRSANFGGSDRSRIELFLGSLPPDQVSRRSHKHTSLQSMALLRTDTIYNCPICGAISRGTENSPPLLHEVVALPALLGGSWISPSCESYPGGVWLRRQLRVYAGDKLWTGRWDYFGDPRCSNFIYGITAAGSYVQRTRRHRRHNLNAKNDTGDFFEDTIFSRPKRQSDDQFAMKNNKKLVLPISLRIDKEFIQWMTPKFAKNFFDIYVLAKLKKQTVLPIHDERNEAIFRKHEIPFKMEFENTLKMKQMALKVTESTEEFRDNALSARSRPSRSLDEVDYYRQLLQSAQPSMAESFAAMLRGNQRREDTTKKFFQSIVPSGTSELDLHVAESLLIAGDISLAKRCGAALTEGNTPKIPRLSNWPSSCVPHSLDAPSTLGLRARISVDWYGQYTLLLGARDKNMWDAPLLQCGPTSMKNPLLRSHLRRSVGLRFGILFSASAASGPGLGLQVMLLWQFLMICFASYRMRSA